MTTATPTAKSILKDSITSIDAGLWTCNVLTDTSEDGQPIGCALGLIGIHSGQATLANRHHKQVWEMLYPDEADDLGEPWPSAALTAVGALAATTEFPAGADVAGTPQEHIVMFNDGEYSIHDESESRPGSKLTPAQAKAWFQRALDALA